VEAVVDRRTPPAGYQTLKFSIRDLLLVTVIAAILLAWWVDHRRQAREIKELKDQQEQQLKKVLERARTY
jgi:hypothetical protein